MSLSLRHSQLLPRDGSDILFQPHSTTLQAQIGRKPKLKGPATGIGPVNINGTAITHHLPEA